MWFFHILLCIACILALRFVGRIQTRRVAERKRASHRSSRRRHPEKLRAYLGNPKFL